MSDQQTGFEAVRTQLDAVQAERAPVPPATALDYQVLSQQLTALLDQEESRRVALDLKYRRTLWLDHGHGSLYGGDGEMQCSHPDCQALDYRRAPHDLLEATVQRVRTKGAGVMRATTERGETVLAEVTTVLSAHCGERGDSEGVTDTLRRIIRERDEMDAARRAAQAESTRQVEVIRDLQASLAVSRSHWR
jgi:hypothetical protein